MNQEIFETIMILTEKLSEITYHEVAQKYKTILKELSAKDIKTEKKGKKKLAYSISKNNNGWYLLFTYKIDPEKLKDFERLLRIDDHVIKFISTRWGEDHYYTPDLESEEDGEKSEQPDALDVLLGLASYKKTSPSLYTIKRKEKLI